VPAEKWVVDLDIFWRHSFGCAMVCREFADRIGYAEPEKAYLVGLLHDIGIIVNSLVYWRSSASRSPPQHPPAAL
jgi:HD-like signal output (HDOD) protein